MVSVTPAAGVLSLCFACMSWVVSCWNVACDRKGRWAANWWQFLPVTLTTHRVTQHLKSATEGQSAPIPRALEGA